MQSGENHVQTVDARYVTRVSLGESYMNNADILTYIMDGNEHSKNALKGILDALPQYSKTPKRRDTRVGGNEAINSYYQFNENDDVIHAINKTGLGDDSGMGRVYNEVFDEQQQIMYMSFGVPDFTNAAKFLEKAYDTDLAKLMNTGGDQDVLSKVGRFLGSVTGLVIKLPWLPIKWALGAFNFGDPPTKYYDFRPTMSLYYKAVNVILAHIAVNMDIASTEDKPYTDGAPELLKDHGLDILTILSRKTWYDKIGEKTSPTVDEMFQKLAGDPDYEKNMWEKAADGAMLGFTEAMRYVGFRVEKSVDSSESASNSTKEPEILGMINQQVSSGRERTFMLKPFANTTVGSVAETLYKGFESVLSGAAESLNLHGGLEMLKGSGFIDIPEIWSSSSFSKSYSFDFQLRTPYGDKFSIFYSLYIPLAMLIAGAFPRSTGQNSYTSPFIVRAYCQGMFAIPMGIIDSITIRRGAPEYGWSADILPTQIDVSFTIKDLSPVMHVAITSDTMKEWANILGQNSTFQEYLLTLSSVNIAQRSLKLELLEKRKQALLTILSNNKLNPLMFGFSLSNTVLGRAITRYFPISRVPGAVPAPRG